ncbi:STAS domain-containing protein [Streptomyces sp. NPDC001415]
MSVEEITFFLRDHVVGDLLVIELHGELDIWAGTTLSGRLEELVNGTCRDVVVDLRPVSFLDACGLRLLLRVRDLVSVRGGRLRLVRPGPKPLRVLRLTRLDRLFTLIDDLPAGPAHPGQDLSA